MKKLAILFALAAVGNSGVAFPHYCDIYYDEVHQKGLFEFASYTPRGWGGDREQTIMCVYPGYGPKFERGTPIEADSNWKHSTKPGDRHCFGGTVLSGYGNVAACPIAR